MKMRKSEAGQGGRKGHSNMAHWQKTDEVKRDASRIRRHNDRLAIAEQEED